MAKVNRRLWPILAGAAVILFSVVLVAGCSVSLIQGDWTKPGGTEEQRRKDVYECERDVRLTYPHEATGAARRLAEKCLTERGYTRR
jgi:hypothetical protein